MHEGRSGFVIAIAAAALLGFVVSAWGQAGGAAAVDTQRLTAEIQAAYANAKDLTLKGDGALFLPDGKIGDVNAAMDFYDGSDKVLEEFFKEWDAVYQAQPALFALLDLLYIQNTRGYAFVYLAAGNADESAAYRQDTVDAGENVLDAIAASTWDNPQFPYIKETIGRYLSEAHIFLALHFKSKGNEAASSEHLRQARETAADPQSKALIESLLKPKQ
jgi:hypothetical protein